MKRGHVESALPLVLFVGVTGSGKTLFKRLLLGQSVPEFSPSTPLTEPAVRTMFICQVEVGGISWKIVSPKEMLDRVANSIKEVPLSTSERPIMGNSENSNPIAEQDSEQPSTTQPTTVSSNNIAIDDALKEIDIDFILLERMKALPADIVGPKLMDVDFLYLLDSGGQPPFREMLPHFVQKADAIVLMLKLNERLDFKPTIRYREEGGKVDEGYISQLTNEQILHQYIQAVQCYASKVFVVGTHIDRESECKGETKEMKNEKLLRAFRPILKTNQLEPYKVGNPDHLIFPVNSTSRKEDSEKIAQEFRYRVKEIYKGKKVKIPLPWFILDQLLMLLSQKMKVSILSTKECYQAAYQKLCMPHNRCESALRHLGEKNIIFYCSDILKGVVFSNAQVLLDKITELVRCSHALRTSNEDNTDAVPHCMHSGEGLLFRDFAQVNPQLLEKAFPSHYREGLFNATNFLELLEGLLIAAKLDDGNHFIPSLLPNLSKEVSEHRVTSLDHPTPLVIHYPKMWLPVGVMPSLVVYLRNECKLEIAQKHGTPACLYHNCIKFRLPEDEPGSIVLIDSTKFLEVHVKSELDSNLCHKIREGIMAGLKKAHKSLHYDPPQVKIGFICQREQCKEKDEPHLAKMNKNKTKWTCSENTEEGGPLTKRERVWLEQSKDTKKGLFC